MEFLLLRDQIKDFIGESKVISACFFSYNFDSEFFENYLLPLFVPEAPFSDNKIQNAILWRRYSNMLPPIMVVCDFHAKGADAPNLDYDVFTRDLPRQNGHKPVFHCKQSYILTKDQRLLVINGSNNLTYSGWCKNIEGFTLEIFENGKFFPRDYKDQYRGFVNNMLKEYPENASLKSIDTFLRKQVYTYPVNTHYWDSGKKSLQEFIDNLIDEDIHEIEVLSPYIYGVGNIDYLKKYSSNIRIAIPFEGANVVGIDEKIYNALIREGINWSRLVGDTVKEFRFNHSKIYRFKGAENMYTLIGSVNFTEMAWKGLKKGGNYENAVAYIEPVENWVAILETYEGDAKDDFRFLEKTENEKRDQRHEVPNLSFTLGWKEKILYYLNKEVYQCKWIPETNNKQISQGEGEIKLTSDQIGQLSKNPAIKITYNGNTFIYYPKQTGMDFKPLPANLKLNNEQIFKLWEELLENNNGGTLQIQLESMLRDRTEDAGEWVEEVQVTSVLNQMATHLSGIIHLEKALFPKKISLEIIHYYLVIDNIDTLWGYLKSIQLEIAEGKLQKGFCWLLLEIVRVKIFDKAIKLQLTEEEKSILKLKREEWMKAIKDLRKQTPDLDEKLLKWVLKQL